MCEILSGASFRQEGRYCVRVMWPSGSDLYRIIRSRMNSRETNMNLLFWIHEIISIKQHLFVSSERFYTSEFKHAQQGDASTGGACPQGDTSTGGRVHRRTRPQGDMSTGGGVHREDTSTGGRVHRGAPRLWRELWLCLNEVVIFWLSLHRLFRTFLFIFIN